MIDWHGLAPEIILALTILVVLFVDLLVPNRAKWVLPAISGFGLLFAAIPLLTLAVVGHSRLLFSGSYQIDTFSLVLKGLFIGAGYATLYLSMNTIEEGAYYRGEFYVLFLSAIFGMFLVASARDLLVLFIAFEAFSTPGYLLAAWKKYDRRSNESGFKYFLLGVVSTAIMLYGMALLYGTTGTTRFGLLGVKLPLLLHGPSAPLVVLGVVLVLVGFAFKVSAVPFHFWAPDTYEGAPTPVTAFFSVSVKAAGFVGLVVLCYVAFGAPAVADIWRPMIWVLAVMTMTFGNLVALRQTNIVRLLAYSSIAQSGYILAPFVVVGTGNIVAREAALKAAVLYLLVYAVMNLGAFGVVISVARKTKSGDLDSYNGLFKVMPVHAVMMALFMASLAGIPPLAGWFGKFQVLAALVSGGSANDWVLAVVVLLNSVIAAFYYMGVVSRMFWREPVGTYLAGIDNERPPAALAAVLGGLTFLVVLGGITPLFTYFASVARIVV